MTETAASGSGHAWMRLPDDVDPEWTARRELAAALRDASERCVRTDADAETLARAARLVADAAALLPEGKTAAEAFEDRSYYEAPSRWIDRGAMAGRSNPIAPPMDVRFEEGESRCELTLGERFVGAPGITHGGILAACFDQVCGHCAVESGYPGLTVELDIRYLRPAHVHRRLELTARVTDVTPKQVEVEGRCARDGELLASCRAVFVVIDRQRGPSLFSGV